MENDGLELIGRLERNSPVPFKFKRTESMCFMRKSSEFTNFDKKKGRENALALAIRNWITSLPPGTGLAKHRMRQPHRIFYVRNRQNDCSQQSDYLWMIWTETGIDDLLFSGNLD